MEKFIENLQCDALSSSVSLFLFTYLFRFGFAGSSRLSRLALAVASRGCSRVAGHRWQWLPFLQRTGSRYTGFSSCSTWAQLFGAGGYLSHGMWDLPGWGIKPMSPALASGFLTTGPTGKSSFVCFKCSFDWKCDSFFCPAIPFVLVLTDNRNRLFLKP